MDVNLNFSIAHASQLLALPGKLEALLMTWQEIANKLSADWDATAARVNADMDKFRTDIADARNLAASLKDQLANVAVPADAQATFDALDAKITGFDVPPPIPPPAPIPPPTG
jgi:hypothetical protein